jgi:hypothetical protein
VQERAACALLKQRFEAAGFTIEDNRPFDEDGIRFELDGFDAQHRVGYEYATEEAGDSWDVDDAVIAALEERRKRGEVYILVVREADAPDAASLGVAADAFLAELRERGVGKAAAARDAEAAHAEPTHAEPTHAEPAHAEPAHAEPAQAEAADAPEKPGEKPGAKPRPAGAKKASKGKAPAKPKAAKKKSSRK